MKNIYKPAVFWGSHRWPVYPQIQSFLYPVLLICLVCHRCPQLNNTAAPALRPLQGARAKSRSEPACEPKKQTKRTVYNAVKMPLRPLVRVWNILLQDSTRRGRVTWESSARSWKQWDCGICWIDTNGEEEKIRSRTRLFLSFAYVANSTHLPPFVIFRCEKFQSQKPCSHHIEPVDINNVVCLRVFMAKYSAIWHRRLLDYAESIEAVPTMTQKG